MKARINSSSGLMWPRASVFPPLLYIVNDVSSYCQSFVQYLWQNYNLKRDKLTVPVRVPEMASILSPVVFLLLNLAVRVSPVSPLTVVESRKEIEVPG